MKRVYAYHSIIDRFLYHEEIMISDGWLVGDIIAIHSWTVADIEKSHKFCDIIQDLKNGKKAWLSDWIPGNYIYLDPKDGIVFHQMKSFFFTPAFNDFLAEDWMEI